MNDQDRITQLEARLQAVEAENKSRRKEIASLDEQLIASKRAIETQYNLRQAVEAERDRYRTALEKQLKRAKRPKRPKGPKIHIILDGKSTMIDCNDQWIAHGSDVRAALPFDQMRHTILREGNPDEVITDTMPVYTGDKLHTIPPCYGA